MGALGQMSKLQLVARIFPITGVVSLTLAVIFEAPAAALGEVLRPAILSKVLEIGGGVMVVVTAEVTLICRTSAMALQVLMSLHQIPIFLGGIVVLHEQVHMLSVSAFALCILGAIIYAAARGVDEGPDASPVKASDIELDEGPSSHAGERRMEGKGPALST